MTDENGQKKRGRQGLPDMNPAGIAIGMGCGVAIGTSLGVAMDNIGIGSVLGLGIGVAFGVPLSIALASANSKDGE